MENNDHLLELNETVVPQYWQTSITSPFAGVNGPPQFGHLRSTNDDDPCQLDVCWYEANADP
ncbi:MAG: hypothetical protein M0Z77_11385 [Thermoplasmatales archaeon]|nr:hypothetical protein [Thermoplasmatales archaeon]